LAERLGIGDKDFATVRSRAADVKKLIIEAATGAIPENKKDAGREEKKVLKKHAERWFKSLEGGAELAIKVTEFGLWPHIEEQLLPFVNAVGTAVSLPEVAHLPL
jgi:putative ATP-dependent endonuclease of OLD family